MICYSIIQSQSTKSIKFDEFMPLENDSNNTLIDNKNIDINDLYKKSILMENKLNNNG